MELLLLVVAFFLYFLPALVATGKKQAGAIIMLNLLLGWTGIGWIVALIWGVSKD